MLRIKAGTTCLLLPHDQRTSDWLYMSRSAMALAPLSAPILHQPSFSVSTCNTSELA